MCAVSVFTNCRKPVSPNFITKGINVPTKVRNSTFINNFGSLSAQNYSKMKSSAKASRTVPYRSASPCYSSSSGSTVECWARGSEVAVNDQISFSLARVYLSD